MGWLSDFFFGKDRPQARGGKTSGRVYQQPDISEPVLSFMQTVRDNPKRFSVTTEVTLREVYFEMCNKPYIEYAGKLENVRFVLTDKKEGLWWDFYGRVSIDGTDFGLQFFNGNGNIIRSIIGINSGPDFLNKNEIQYLFNGFKEVYATRVARYNLLIEYRSKREADKRQAIKDAANRAERKALMEVYCK
tara:strand:- start:1391 stop:1960 length:570 start_codon:yes stop_codon:yes gene_type:complete